MKGQFRKVVAIICAFALFVTGLTIQTKKVSADDYSALTYTQVGEKDYWVAAGSDDFPFQTVEDQGDEFMIIPQVAAGTKPIWPNFTDVTLNGQAFSQPAGAGIYIKYADLNDNAYNVFEATSAVDNHRFQIIIKAGTPVEGETTTPDPDATTVAPTTKVTVDGEEVAVENGKVTLGDAKYGYLCANKMYKAGTEVTVNEDMEFTSVNTLSVAMTDGAGIRYIGESGLRFQSTIASDNMEAVASDAITEGTLITTKVIFDNNNDTLELGYSHAMINVKNSGWFGDKVGTYCGSVCKITDNKREFIARSYVTVNYEDGTSKTVYSGMGPSRSVQFVAQAIIADGYKGIAEEYHSVIDNFAK